MGKERWRGGAWEGQMKEWRSVKDHLRSHKGEELIGSVLIYESES